MCKGRGTACGGGIVSYRGKEAEYAVPFDKALAFSLRIAVPTAAGAQSPTRSPVLPHRTLASSLFRRCAPYATRCNRRLRLQLLASRTSLRENATPWRFLFAHLSCRMVAVRCNHRLRLQLPTPRTSLREKAPPGLFLLAHLFGFAKRCKPHKNLGKGKRPFAGSLPESTSKA